MCDIERDKCRAFIPCNEEFSLGKLLVEQPITLAHLTTKCVYENMIVMGNKVKSIYQIFWKPNIINITLAMDINISIAKNAKAWQELYSYYRTVKENKYFMENTRHGLYYVGFTDYGKIEAGVREVVSKLEPCIINWFDERHNQTYFDKLRILFDNINSHQEKQLDKLFEFKYDIANTYSKFVTKEDDFGVRGVYQIPRYCYCSSC